MTKLIEAAVGVIKRNTYGNLLDESSHSVPKGMHRMPDGSLMKNSDHSKKKDKKEVEESFLLSQEEFQSLSEEDQEEYVNQLMELKHNMLKSNKMSKKIKMM